jgi:predicted esterase YcpF (UPF0227 family)
MLYYIHGYQSSPDGDKAELLKKALQVKPIRYRDKAPEELVISECLNRISHAIAKDDEVILIGSSLGGFLAARTALDHPTVKKLILLNPAIIPLEIDLTTVKGMPLRILQDMKETRLFTEKIPATITILRGTLDDVVPDEWILSFAQAQNATIRLYSDDHRFSKNLQRLPEIITEVLQQGS